LDVLAGIRMEHWPKIRQVVIEVHDIAGRLKQITSMLREHGFELTVWQETALKNTGLYAIYALRPTAEPTRISADRGSAAGQSLQLWMNPKLLVGDVRAYLKEKLPQYMVPSTLMLLEELPLSPNGKLDRKALPVPLQGGVARESDYVAPRTQIEEMLASMWAEVLRVERVGITDNFFELGGHSLLATRLMSQVRQVFAVEVALRALFEAPTIAGLAGHIEQVKQSSAGLPTPPTVSTVSRQQYRVKLPTQGRLVLPDALRK